MEERTASLRHRIPNEKRQECLRLFEQGLRFIIAFILAKFISSNFSYIRIFMPLISHVTLYNKTKYFIKSIDSVVSM